MSTASRLPDNPIAHVVDAAGNHIWAIYREEAADGRVVWFCECPEGDRYPLARCEHLRGFMEEATSGVLDWHYQLTPYGRVVADTVCRCNTGRRLVQTPLPARPDDGMNAKERRAKEREAKRRAWEAEQARRSEEERRVREAEEALREEEARARRDAWLGELRLRRGAGGRFETTDEGRRAELARVREEQRRARAERQERMSEIVDRIRAEQAARARRWRERHGR